MRSGAAYSTGFKVSSRANGRCPIYAAIGTSMGMRIDVPEYARAVRMPMIVPLRETLHAVFRIDIPVPA